MEDPVTFPNEHPVATGPFITTANDVVSMLIYVGLASWVLRLGQAG